MLLYTTHLESYGIPRDCLIRKGDEDGREASLERARIHRHVPTFRFPNVGDGSLLS
jgi:hypothetical protein